MTSTATNTPRKMAATLTRTVAATTAVSRRGNRICGHFLSPAYTRAASSSKDEAQPPAQQDPPQAQAQEIKPSFSTSASTLAAQAAAKPLPFLNSAPGFPFPPSVIANEPSPPPSSSSSSSSSKSKASSTTTTTTDTSKPSRAAAAATRDAKIYVERKAILSEATKGYFHDFHALRAHGGKTWRAPTSLIRSERSNYWPDWSGKRLSDGENLSTASLMKGKITLVSVLSSQASEGHVKSFNESTLRTYDSHPDFQHVVLNVQLSTLRAFLMRIVFNTLRSGVEEAQRGMYFLCTSAPALPARVLEMELEAAKRAAGGLPSSSEEEGGGGVKGALASMTSTNKTSNSPGAEAYLRSALHLHNKHVGYVFLVDQRCRIRWAGGGFAEEGEREALRACTGVLLARH
ncbi:hypothetical protein CF319_g1333 [Tilletia indica]|nr:hypothetical protein CF319_g1333 [Tilletia indica]